MRKPIAVALLSLVFCFSLLPAHALAATASNQSPVTVFDATVTTCASKPAKVQAPKKPTLYSNYIAKTGKLAKVKASFKKNRMIISGKLFSGNGMLIGTINDKKLPSKRNAFKLNKKSFIGWYCDCAPSDRNNDKLPKKGFAKQLATGEYKLDIIVQNGFVISAKLM